MRGTASLTYVGTLSGKLPQLPSVFWLQGLAAGAEAKPQRRHSPCYYPFDCRLIVSNRHCQLLFNQNLQLIYTVPAIAMGHSRHLSLF